jgi:uncharacterized damage-inducible protein DinB
MARQEMAPQEKTELIQNLERTREEFLATLAGLSESQAKVRPDPERWSVLECVEHVASVEERFLSLLQSASKNDTPRVDREKEAGLMARIADRTTRIQAPETVWPKGRFTTLADAIEEFNAGRTRSIQFAQDRCDDLYCLASAHPRLGPMNGAEFLVLIAAHGRRHAAQIREARAALEKN